MFKHSFLYSTINIALQKTPCSIKTQYSNIAHSFAYSIFYWFLTPLMIFTWMLVIVWTGFSHMRNIRRWLQNFDCFSWTLSKLSRLTHAKTSLNFFLFWSWLYYAFAEHKSVILTAPQASMTCAYKLFVVSLKNSCMYWSC